MGIVGAVLAGGRSTRMGRDKSLILVDGQPLAARTAAILASCGCETVYIVGRQVALRSLDWPVIVDNGPHHHPLFGVAAALSGHQEGLVLVAPCDIVNLSVDHVLTLIRHGGSCVGMSAGRVHPLLAIYPGSYAQKAEELATQNAPAMALCDNLQRVSLPLPELRDANQKTDLPR